MYSSCSIPLEITSEVLKDSIRNNWTKCPQCTFETISKLVLLRHTCDKQQKQPLERKEFTCDECDRVLTTKQNLQTHIRTQHRSVFKRKVPLCSSVADDLCFQCGHCSFKSVYKGSLKRHLLTRHPHKHNFKEWYTCGDDKYQFMMKSNLSDDEVKSNVERSPENYRRLFGRTYGKRHTKND